MSDAQHEFDPESTRQQSFDLKKEARKSHIRTSQKRTEDWSKEEKKVVTRALKNGRRSVVNLTKQLRGTKSLRQVAQYLERQEFWSNLLGKLPPPDNQSRSIREAKEVSSKKIDAECLNTQEVITVENSGLKAQSDAFRAQVEGSAGEIRAYHYKHYELIKYDYLNTLLQVIREDNDCSISAEAVTFLGRVLEEYVRNAMREILTVAPQLGYHTFAEKPTDSSVVTKKMVLTALNTCGYSSGKPASKIAEEIIARNVPSWALRKMRLIQDTTSDDDDDDTSSEHDDISQSNNPEPGSEGSDNTEIEHSETGLDYDTDDFIVDDERTFHQSTYSTETYDNADSEDEEVKKGRASKPKNDGQSSDHSNEQTT
ncbi:hypothetical protein H4R24_000440 [Coemansia sp. RSA 988]|nr:hypothetical protein H4R24_000440 [Coemansia sp. RSA 988]